MANHVPHIRWLTYFLTEACNLNCEYCYLAKKPVRSNAAVGKAVVDFLISSSGPAGEIHLRFFGGEPLLELALLEEVALCAQTRARNAAKQITFDVVSNGTLLSPHTTERLRSLGAKVMISLDGGPATMRANRGLTLTPGAFARFEAQIAFAIQMGVATAARMTVLPNNDVGSDISHLVESGHRRILVCLARNLRWEEGQVEAVYEAVARLYIAYARQGRILPLELTNRLLRLRHLWHSGYCMPLEDAFCAAGREMLSASVDGSLFLCHRFVQLGDRFCAGNVFDGLDSERLSSFGPLTRDSFRHEGCPSCSAEGFCPGSCMAANYAAGGDLFRPDPCHCLEFRAHAKAVAQIYETLTSEPCRAFAGFLDNCSRETRQTALRLLRAEMAAV